MAVYLVDLLQMTYTIGPIMAVYLVDLLQMAYTIGPIMEVYLVDLLQDGIYDWSHYGG